MPKDLTKDLRSWKTTLCGVIGALMVWLPQILVFIQGGDLNFKALVIGLTILGGGIVAKDGDKSTEDVSK